MIYLDHAATTPVAREVADTMYDVLLNGSGNPSSQYPYGAAAKKRLEADRAVIAAALGCKPDELYFTALSSRFHTASSVHLGSNTAEPSFCPTVRVMPFSAALATYCAAARSTTGEISPG